MLPLNDRVALVTGASAGLGAGIAHELTARGARVLLASRSPERLAATARAIAEACGPDAHAPAIVAGDLTEPATAGRLVAAARDRFGRLDILVGNAGGPPPGDFAAIDDEAWRAGFDLVFLSAVRLVRAALPLLKAADAGRIVLTTSISGLKPVPRLAISNALRPAVMGLVRHLALELADDGILVNAVAPGFFDTQRSREVQAAIAAGRGVELAQVQAETAARIPLGREGEPRELGRLVAFLVSPENSYLTGQTLVYDGGLLLAQ